MGIWDVRDESDREQWVYRPFAEVGPLRFGMSPDEAVAALAGFEGTADSRIGRFQRPGIPARQPAVTVYFDDPGGLFCVVPDARSGPQVTLDGIDMVGRAPSRWEADLLEYESAHGIGLHYAPGGDLGSDDLGLIMNVQRAGDLVLTRPVLLIQRDRAGSLWDSLPADETLIISG